jgi:uncharacterized protein YdiU (UPF0061 family)
MGWHLDNSYARLPLSFFTRQNPVAVPSPELVIFNAALATELGLNVQATQGRVGLAILSGNQVPETADPLAQAYAGHQFGHFTMLGDGRALLLGEQITPTGERFDIQLKGSGPTPYSRGGDGRAALGPMLREYIISEAMQALGIATTRSLAVVTTGETVLRETDLPGAILTRVAASHLRVGTFQYLARYGTIDDLRILADYTIQRHFPDLSQSGNPYLSLLQAVIKSQARLIAQWQLVGFIHGVMNTDNMAISGETIDYGPCAFMDAYDPATVFSSIDSRGRYAFGNQPSIAGWNLARFAETLLPLLATDSAQAIQLAQDQLDVYFELYYDHYHAGLRAKLGLLDQEADDEALVKELLDLMQNNQTDYTNTFRALTFDQLDDLEMFKTPEFTIWYQHWQARLDRMQGAREDAHQLMRNSNPAVIPRNHLVEAALEAAVKQGNYRVMADLMSVLAHPYAHTPEQAEYASGPEASSRHYRTFCGT